ncbi:MAG: hypothetical protein KKF50_02900 [Nanoarchaeota archaeon]|nr:hypothetical protein [Nanoarchaeota archaeon]
MKLRDGLLGFLAGAIITTALAVWIPSISARHGRCWYNGIVVEEIGSSKENNYGLVVRVEGTERNPEMAGEYKFTISPSNSDPRRHQILADLIQKGDKVIFATMDSGYMRRSSMLFRADRVGDVPSTYVCLGEPNYKYGTPLDRR